MEVKNLELVEDLNEANAITHGGKFHIDEVFATVLLTKIFDNIKLSRVSEINNQFNYKDKIIYDIGKGEFDHHQSDAEIREDGIKYSSFGLLWRKFGRHYLKKIGCKDIAFAWKQLDASLVKTIDKIDNFQIEKDYLKNYMIANIIENFNPNWNSETDSNIKFKEAVEFAAIIFDNEIDSILSRIDAKEYLKSINIESNRYIVLEKIVPYSDFIAENDTKEKIEFVIYPSKRNGYEIRTIFNRNSFPKEWSSLSEEEFYKKYNIEGMLYCHNNGKLCIARDVKSAINIIGLT